MSTISRMVSVEAKPASIAIDLAKTAVLVIDMQNDFGAAGGDVRPRWVRSYAIQQAVAPTARVVAGARAAGIRIVYVNEALRADLSDIATVDRLIGECPSGWASETPSSPERRNGSDSDRGYMEYGKSS